MKLLLLIVTGLLCFSLHAQEWSHLPSDHGSPARGTPMVEADAPELLYVGRFDHDDPKIAVSEWPNSAVRLKFRGTGVKASLALGGNRILVAIDGNPARMLVWDDQSKAETGPRTYALAEGLPDGEHEVTLTKATEAFYGPLRVYGFDISGKILSPTPNSRRITVIGDSITTGAGNESDNKDEHMSPDNQNAWWTYGAISARAFGADYVAIAWSGRKLWQDPAISEILDRTLPSRSDSSWPGDKEPPDVIVINLCANDFRQDNPEKGAWTKAYHDLLDHLRRQAPKAGIYCAIGPMIHDFWPPGKQARTHALEYIQSVVGERNAVGDPKVRLLDFGVYDREKDGIGADWHPTVRTHQATAAILISTIESDLSWKRK